MRSAELDRFAARLGEVCREFGLGDEEAVSRCCSHFEVLTRWNRAMNLVGDLDADASALRHYGEGLFLARALPDWVGVVGDFGSGAGFPGVCVAAACRSARVVLMESRSKRAAFLSEATRGWSNVEVFCGLAESYVSRVDCWVARGVDPLLVLRHAASRTLSRYAVGVLVSRSAGADLEPHASDLGLDFDFKPLPWRPEAAICLLQRASIV